MLIVDDDRALLEVLSEMLQAMEFNVETARDGVEGWQKYLEYLPQVVISDIYMPKKNGLVLLALIKEHNPSQVVILITGYSHYRQISSNWNPPPDGFLQKPFTAKEIYNSIILAFKTNREYSKAVKEAEAEAEKNSQQN